MKINELLTIASTTLRAQLAVVKNNNNMHRQLPAPRCARR
jgi:hypothetical protein